MRLDGATPTVPAATTAVFRWPHELAAPSGVSGTPTERIRSLFAARPVHEPGLTLRDVLSLTRIDELDDADRALRHLIEGGYLLREKTARDPKTRHMRWAYRRNDDPAKLRTKPRR